MASVVKSVICSVITDSSLFDWSEPSKLAKEQARIFLQATEEKCVQSFDQFCGALTKTVEKNFFACVSAGGACRSKFVQREKLWSSFHHLRTTTLSELWQNFLSQPDVPNLSPLVYQYVNQKLYEKQMKSHFSTDCEPTAADPASCEYPEITVDEENIIRYAAGYVPYKLMKKYEHQPSATARYFVECLGNMAINGEESSLMEYTSKWISLCNRGGLFEINDISYLMFRDIELKVRKCLFSILGRTTTCGRETIICSVASDLNVQFYWGMLSVDIEDEDSAIQLLKEIIGLWVTMRGFTIAGCWLEHYKQATKAHAQKGLRKELKRTSTGTMN